MTLHVDRAGSGPDLVLLHGWAMHAGAWDEALPALSRRYRVHAVDLPGHGHSAHAPANCFDDAVEAVAAAVPRDAIVCGWSLGGLVAQRLARRHPERVRALALVASTPCFARRADWPHAMDAATLDAFARGLDSDRDATLERFVRLNALHGAASREAMRAFAARLQQRGRPPVEALHRGLAWLRETDLREDARHLRLPVVVIHGQRDMLAPVAAAQWLARALPAATLVEIPGAAHLPFFTHREAFVAAMERLRA